MAFDPKKPVQTRDGFKARIICKNLKGNYPIAAAVTDMKGVETVDSYTKNGNQYIDNDYSKYDLINIPE